MPALEIALPRTASPAPRVDIAAAAVTSTEAVATEAAVEAAEPPARRVGWASVALVVWIAGVLAVLARLILAHARVARLAAAARPVRHAEWLEATRDVAARCGLRRPVELFETDHISVPFVRGVRSPALFLPRDAEAWDAGRREAVLAHELAHVRRRDCLTQSFANLACAFHWYNPLVWLAARQLLVERERAADDWALRLGARASEYAAHLVALARYAGKTAVHQTQIATLAERSDLESRVRSILDVARSRRVPGPAATLLTVSVAAGLLVPIAGLCPADRQVASAAPRAEAGVGPVGEPSTLASDPTPEPSSPQRRPRSTDSEDRSLWPSPTPSPTPEPFADESDADDPSLTEPSADDDDVARALKEATNDPDEGVRRQAKWALRMIRIGRGEVPGIHNGVKVMPTPRIHLRIEPKPIPDPVPAPRPDPSVDRDDH